MRREWEGICDPLSNFILYFPSHLREPLGPSLKHADWIFPLELIAQYDALHLQPEQVLHTLSVCMVQNWKWAPELESTHRAQLYTCMLDIFYHLEPNLSFFPLVSSAAQPLGSNVSHTQHVLRAYNERHQLSVCEWKTPEWVLESEWVRQNIDWHIDQRRNFFSV